jgi:hypothetical protein
LTLRNISFEFKGGGTADLIDRELPELPERYPEYPMFGPTPSCALFVRHVQECMLADIRLRVAEHDERPALAFDDVEGLRVDGCVLDGGTAQGAVSVRNVRGGSIRNCRIHTDAPRLLIERELQNRDIVLDAP